MDYVGEEWNGLFRVDVGDGSSLDPLGKFVDGYYLMRVYPYRPLDGPHEVEARNHKQLGDGDHL